MGEMTPAERSMRSRLGSYTSWAQTDDRSARTAPARQAFIDKFEREVDPEGKLSIPERAKRAEAARKAHYTRLALKSAQVRRQRRERGAA